MLSGNLSAGLVGVFVVEQHQAVLVFVERLDHVAIGQVEMRGVGREWNSLGSVIAMQRSTSSAVCTICPM